MVNRLGGAVDADVGLPAGRVSRDVRQTAVWGRLGMCRGSSLGRGWTREESLAVVEGA